MQTSTNPKKRNRTGFREVRILITAVAVAGTVGLWTWFSKQEMITQALALKVIEPTVAQPPQETVLQLAPIPTLIPPLPENNSLALAPAQSSSASSVTVPSINNQVRVFLGGSAPSLRRSVPQPVTRTRSSQ
jgi:cytoskeletal protein RodZ